MVEIFVVAEKTSQTRGCISALGAEGWQVSAFDPGEQALEVLNTHQPLIIIIDTRLPDSSGFDVIRQIRSNSDKNDLVVFMIVFWDTKCEGDKPMSGIDIALNSPVEPDEMVKFVHCVLRSLLGDSTYGGAQEP